MASAKKPSLADVALEESGDEEEAPESGDDYGVAVDELAEVLGVTDDKMQAFRDAFQAACMSCR